MDCELYLTLNFCFTAFVDLDLFWNSFFFFLFRSFSDEIFENIDQIVIFIKIITNFENFKVLSSCTGGHGPHAVAGDN